MTRQNPQSKTDLSLDDAKRRIALRTIEGHNLVLNESQGQDAAPLQEERDFPPFVRHCVAAMARSPETMSRLKQKVGKKRAGSAPYAICQDRYNRSKRRLAAKHATGSHHTKADFEKAIKTLAKMREDNAASRPPRDRIIFETACSEEVKGARRRAVRFAPAEEA